jgi:predicted transcriptional regulator of viral defense system
VLSRLKKLNEPVLRTSDIIGYLKINKAQASTILARLADFKHIVRVKRGLWVFPENLDPLSLSEYLTSPFPSYISLQSALFFHGMISQIPETIYSVSVARTKLYKTPLGTFSIHHINPTFFFGYQLSQKSRIKMATPEKALLDFLYMQPAKSKIFSSLPELELPPKFNIKTARKIICQGGTTKRLAFLNKKFEEFLSAYTKTKS